MALNPEIEVSMMKLLALFAFVCSSSLLAIEGKYSVTGYDPYNKMSYSGTAVITKDKNNVYQINWTYNEGGEIYRDKGTGIKMNDIVSFIFKNAEGEKSSDEGVQVYKVKNDILEGPYVLLGQNLVGTEKLKKQ
jgi:hypothetical protein